MNLSEKLQRLLPHLVIIFALTFLIFSILDWYNPLMGFTTNTLSMKLLVIFCLMSLLLAIENILLLRPHERRRSKKS